MSQTIQVGIERGKQIYRDRASPDPTELTATAPNSPNLATSKAMALASKPVVATVTNPFRSPPMRVVDYKPGLIVRSSDPGSLVGSRKLTPATTIGDCWIVGQMYFCNVRCENGATHIRALPRLQIQGKPK